MYLILHVGNGEYMLHSCLVPTQSNDVRYLHTGTPNSAVSIYRCPRSSDPHARPRRRCTSQACPVSPSAAY